MEFSISKENIISKLNVDKDDGNLNLIIDEMIELAEKIIKPKSIYKYFDITKEFKIKDSEIYLEGKNIKQHLKNCNEIIILAVTLGIEIEKKIRQLEMIDLTKYLILDLCASSAIESVKKSIENELREETRKINMFITSGFSPGYGDFSIEIQKKIQILLQMQKRIGVTVSENYLMIPRKSITAVYGISDVFVEGKFASCGGCVLNSKCEYREKGITCGD